MTRMQLTFAFLAIGLAILSLTHADTLTSNKPECAPLQDLYRAWIAPCTGNLQSIPNTDADPRWKPCVCRSGFFPIAQAIENCTLTGTNQPPKITTKSIDTLCNGHVGYQAAEAQITPSPLVPALATSTNIAQQRRGGGGGGGGGSSAAGQHSLAYALAVSMILSVLVAATTI
ncbi:hypothetical protein BGW38_008444 [Lunasporangiospora selenospora]|uniref:Uncharacterized protein n=1 Tax=Lunasporangiospora selenospora TaxID=979761 RepID=A0A9P6FY81_9FUNG|nr:hypothetical protein BGW38_008444 [Lunasporangiospora selenospora]